MTALLSLAILVLIAYLGSLLYRKINIDSIWLKGVVYSGVFYIILGYLIGPKILRLVTESVFHELNILFSLVLGWSGFLTGLQLSLKGLRRFPGKYYTQVSIIFTIVLVLLSTTLWISDRYLINLPFSLQAIIMFAVTGSVSSPIMLGVLMKDQQIPGKMAYRLQFNSAYDNVLGVLAGGMVFIAGTAFYWHGEESMLKGLQMLFPYGVVGAAIFMYSYIYENMKTGQEKFLLFISLLIITIGIAYKFSQSILFFSFLFGFGLANSKIPSRQLYRDIQELEKPLYILLLIFTGINLKLYSEPAILIFAVVFIIFRLIIKYVSESTVYIVSEKDQTIPHTIGIAGIGIGGLALAMALDYLIIYNTQTASIILFIIVVSLVPNDLFSILYIKKALTKRKKINR